MAAAAASSSSKALPMEDAVVASSLREVDAHARQLLRTWGDKADPSQAAVESLKDMYLAAQLVPHEILKTCERMRLVALTVRIMEVFETTHDVGGAAPEALALCGRTWLDEAAKVANGDGAARAKWDWAAGLRMLRDVGMDAAMECEQTGGELPSSDGGTDLLPKLLKAIRFISDRVISPLPGQTDTTEACEQAFEKPLFEDEHEADLLDVAFAVAADPEDAVKVSAVRTAGYGRALSDGADLSVPARAEPYSRAWASRGVCRSKALEGRDDGGVRGKRVGPLSAEAQAMFEDPVFGIDDGEPGRVPWAPATAAASTVGNRAIVRKPGYARWSLEEERRLLEGYNKYPNQWETIRTTYGLHHKTGGQLKDKWRNLKKAEKDKA